MGKYMPGRLFYADNFFCLQVAGKKQKKNHFVDLRGQFRFLLKKYKLFCRILKGERLKKLTEGKKIVVFEWAGFWKTLNYSKNIITTKKILRS